MHPYVMHLFIGSVPLYFFLEKRDVSPAQVLYFTNMYLQSGSTFCVIFIFMAPNLISVWCFLSVELISLHLYNALTVVPSSLALASIYCFFRLMLLNISTTLRPSHDPKEQFLCVCLSLKLQFLHWSLVLSVLTFGLPNFFSR